MSDFASELGVLHQIAAEVQRVDELRQVPAGVDVDELIERLRRLHDDLARLAPQDLDRRVDTVKALVERIQADWEADAKRGQELATELSALTRDKRETTARNYERLAGQAEDLAAKARAKSEELRLSRLADKCDELEAERERLLSEADQLAAEYATVTEERKHVEAEHELPAERHIRRQRSLRHQIAGRHRRSAELQRRIEELAGRLAAV